MSFGAGAAVQAIVPAVAQPVAQSQKSWLAEQGRVIRLVAKKPSFVIMVAQGVTGGVPWNAFAFLTFYFQLSGYTDLEAGQIMTIGGCGGIAGALIGGKLGDYFHGKWPFGGRCFVAQLSVVLGIVCFYRFIHVPFGPGSFYAATFAYFLFTAVATWTPAAALRPICGEVMRNSQDRAQILALWIALEGIIASVCGAPLAGRLSEAFGYKLDKATGMPAASERATSLAALRRALMGVSMVPWVICALAWIPMYWTYPKDVESAERCAKDGDVGQVMGNAAQAGESGGSDKSF